MGEQAERKMQLHKVISMSGKVLLSQVNDFLDFAQIREGTFRITKEIFYVRAAIDEVFDMFKMNAEVKQLKFECSYSDSLPKLVKADRVRIQQVLRNYLANALKFTQKGSITVRVGYHKLTQLLKVEVLDTGFGISEENQKKLFKPFSMLKEDQG